MHILYYDVNTPVNRAFEIESDAVISTPFRGVEGSRKAYHFQSIRTF